MYKNTVALVYSFIIRATFDFTMNDLAQLEC